VTYAEKEFRFLHLKGWKCERRSPSEKRDYLDAPESNQRFGDGVNCSEIPNSSNAGTHQFEKQCAKNAFRTFG